MKKGFTLLELLIALVVLSIGMMGIFTLVSQSLDMNYYAKRKLVLLNKAYERVILTLSEKKELEDTLIDNGTLFKYNLKSNEIGIPGIKEFQLTVTDGTAETTLIYYDR